MIDDDFQDAVLQYRQAMDAYLEQLQRGKLDSDYYRAGRAARRALRRCFRIAAAQRIVWTPGDCRTFY